MFYARQIGFCFHSVISFWKTKKADRFFSSICLIGSICLSCRFEWIQSGIFAAWHLSKHLEKFDPNMRKSPIKSGFFGGHLFCHPLMVRLMGLEPIRINHTPLKRARLPIPPQPQTAFPCALRRTDRKRCDRSQGKGILFWRTRTDYYTQIIGFVKCFWEFFSKADSPKRRRRVQRVRRIGPTVHP